MKLIEGAFDVLFKPLSAIEAREQGQRIPVVPVDGVYDMINREGVIVGSITLLDAIQDCHRYGTTLSHVGGGEIEVLRDGVNIGLLLEQCEYTIDLFYRSESGVK